MIQVEKLEVEGKSLLGLRVEMPGTPPMLLILGERGFVMCGYLNLEVAEKLGAAAAIVTGVNTFEDVLNAEIKAATSKGETVGLKPGRVVREIIGGIT
jgi:uncharacterized protein YunC (DUF1805 family)